jgi:SpoVK/Ycf46/Vps4 family AAA+-type ATPase
MDEHPLPFIAATNHPHRLDPAAMRRFVFKLSLDALAPERSALAWTRFFAPDPPPALARIAGLTPGDFAVVARQLRFAPTTEPAMILRLLEAEVRAKPVAGVRIGF